MTSVNKESSEELAPLVAESPAVEPALAPATTQRAVAAPLWLQVALCSSFFVVSVGLVFLNKYLFGYLPRGDAAGALTPTIVMLLGAAVLLGLLAAAQRLAAGRSLRPARPSWRGALLFGLPALAFAAVMALTNTSLELTSVNLHVVLKSTAIVWTVLLAWLLERERPSPAALLCCAVLAAGAAMASWSPDRGLGFAGHDTAAQRAAAVALTAAAAVAQGVLLVLTRRTARVLGGGASLELAAVKTAAAGLLLLPLGGGLDPDGWARLGTMPPLAAGLLAAGVFATSLFQGLLVGAQSVTLATTAGVLSAAAVVPQLAIAFAAAPPAQPLAAAQIAGYVLAPLAACAYLALSLYEKKRAFRTVL